MEKRDQCLLVPKICGNDLLILQHDIGRTARQRAPVIEHMNPVGEVGDHLHIMLDPDHGNTELMLDAQDETGEVLALLAVEAGRRFVEQQDRGLVGERAGKADDLLGAERQPADRGVAIALQLDEFDDLLHRLALADFLTRAPRAETASRRTDCP